MKKRRSTVNVAKLLKENTQCRVSPEAVEELVARIHDGISELGPGLDKIALRDGRKTIKAKDVILYYDYHEGWL